MSGKEKADPLYKLIARIRRPAAYRELIAACLRSVYTGDPFACDGREPAPQMPIHLLEKVKTTELNTNGVRCVRYSRRESEGPSPLLLYMHGGGFVVGCSEDTDYLARTLSYSNRLTVLSVNYRLAPEVVFPGALEDCEAALNFALEHSQELGLNSNCIYLAGDSAGGNLAVSLYHRLTSLRRSVKGLILFAPWLDMEVEKYESYNRLAPTNLVIDSPFIGYARAAYCNFEQWKNESVSPILSKLQELPPTLALVGTEDPLLDQTLELERKASQSGATQIEIVTYQGMPHCFYSFPGLFVEEQDAQVRVSSFLQKHIR